MNITRRGFLGGCSAAIAAMAGSRISQMAFAAEPSSASRNTLVVLFLRGGWDALNLAAPVSDRNYQEARTILALNERTVPNPEDRLVLTNPLPGAEFWLHPAARPLAEIYAQGDLAIVHATGLTNGTRSHFDAMDYIELGTPTNTQTASGWLTRHLTSIGAVNNTNGLSAVALGSSLPTSLRSALAAVSMTSSGDFDLSGNRTLRDRQKAALRQLYAGTTPLHRSGSSTLDIINFLATNRPPNPDPDPYPVTNSLARSLRTIAQLIKMEMGLQVVGVDYGGWDHHARQDFFFPNNVGALATALAAFYNDLSAFRDRVVVVVMSEFGRRLKENASSGTDHGYGGAMLVMGGAVRGGRMYGDWPGLAKEQLNRNVDLEITTDYRVVLGELLVHQFGNTKLGQVFPGLTEELYARQVRGLVSDPSAQPSIDFTPGDTGNGANRVYLPLIRSTP